MEFHKINYGKSFEFEAGGHIPELEIAYHCSEGGYRGKNVIWICHALTANSDPSDWWSTLVGPGMLIDTEKYFVVCVNMLGSCYGTSGPSSVNPETGSPYYFDFPKVTVRDIVRCMDIVRESLGIEKIDLLIGSSIGGFQALEMTITYPERISRAIFMATASRVSPWLTGFEESQRMALEADPSFRRCGSLDGGKEALKCARSIAMLSYRCDTGYNCRQSEPDDDTVFAGRSASYQRHQGKKLADRFNAYSYWYLSYSVDSENVGRGRGGEAKALGTIHCPVTVVSIDTDLIFPPKDMEVMAGNIPGAEYHEIKSLFGHDGFLLETGQITAIIKPLLEKI